MYDACTIDYNIYRRSSPLIPVEIMRTAPTFDVSSENEDTKSIRDELYRKKRCRVLQFVPRNDCRVKVNLCL